MVRRNGSVQWVSELETEVCWGFWESSAFLKRCPPPCPAAGHRPALTCPYAHHPPQHRVYGALLHHWGPMRGKSKGGRKCPALWWHWWVVTQALDSLPASRQLVLRDKQVFVLYLPCLQWKHPYTQSSFLFLLSPLPPTAHGPSYSTVPLFSLFLPPFSYPCFSGCLPLEHPLYRALHSTQERKQEPATHSLWECPG